MSLPCHSSLSYLTITHCLLPTKRNTHWGRFAVGEANIPLGFAKEHCKLTDGLTRYKVEAVGDRHGILKRNRRLARAFPFLPDDIPGWRVKQQLDSGPWAGEWRIESAADQVRKVVFQEHAQVCAKLHLPAVDTYPMATAIPFKLELQTTTRPLKEKDVSKKEADDHLFPYPPDMSEIKFELKTRHRVKSDYKLKESWSKSEDLFKGNTSIQEIRVDPKTTQSGDKFFIEQSNTVTGNIILNTTAPGYTADLHIVQHELILKVPFSGLTNNLNITIPLEVTSGCSAQDVEHASYDMLPDYYDIADSDDESKGGDVKKYLGKLTGGS